MKALTAKQTVTVLIRHGFSFSRNKGSHEIYRNNQTGISAPVPFHAGNKPIHIGTFLAIVRQSKIPKKKFGKNLWN